MSIRWFMNSTKVLVYFSAVFLFNKIDILYWYRVISILPLEVKNTGYKNNSLNDNLETKLGLDSIHKFSIKNTVRQINGLV